MKVFAEINGLMKAKLIPPILSIIEVRGTVKAPHGTLKSDLTDTVFWTKTDVVKNFSHKQLLQKKLFREKPLEI